MNIRARIVTTCRLSAGALLVAVAAPCLVIPLFASRAIAQASLDDASLARARDGQAPGSAGLGTDDLLPATEGLGALEERYRRELATLQSLPGEHRADIARASNNLGFVLLSAGKLDESESKLREALAAWESLPKSEAERAIVLNNLGELSFRSNRVLRAKAYFERSLELRLKAVPKDDALLAISYHNLAYAKSAVGDYVEAVPLYERALELSERLFGADDPRTAHALQNLGEALREVGSEQRAESYLVRALAIRTARGVPEAEVSELSLGELYLATNALPKAEEHIRRALALAERRAGEHARELLPVLEDLALVLVGAGRMPEAELVYRRSLAIDPRQPSVLNNLGFVAVETGRYDEAYSSYARGLELLEEEPSADRLELVKPIRALARVALLRKSPEQAVELLRRAENIQGALAPQSAELIEIWTQLATAYLMMGQSDLARANLQRAEDSARAIYGSSSAEAAEIAKRRRDLARHPAGRAK